jgi:hypothetical protein
LSCLLEQSERYEPVREKVEELEKIIQKYKLLPKEEKKKDWRNHEVKFTIFLWYNLFLLGA